MQSRGEHFNLRGIKFEFSGRAVQICKQATVCGMCDQFLKVNNVTSEAEKRVLLVIGTLGF